MMLNLDLALCVPDLCTLQKTSPIVLIMLTVDFVFSVFITHLLEFNELLSGKGMIFECYVP